MKVAIIGAGNVGTALATSIARGGHRRPHHPPRAHDHAAAARRRGWPPRRVDQTSCSERARTSSSPRPVHDFADVAADIADRAAVTCRRRHATAWRRRRVRRQDDLD